MASASGAAAAGASVLLADERAVPGGVLPQCIHHGFGLGCYGEDLTGPEYCAREADRFRASGASYLPSARVTELRPDRTALISSPDGLFECSFDQVILATGCREKPLYALNVAGTRPSGIHTAGETQELLNLGHYDIGNRAVILGSGDIGQIMARRLTLTGRTVVLMAEINGSLGGMKRNHEECIEAYRIPVVFHATVTAVHGYPALTAVTIHHLDTGTDEIVPCDTLITALGLIPERSLADPLRENGTYPAWLHLCGNADHVHEIVDSVTAEGLRLGQALGAGRSAK
jgi:NADPH-dependent 2,4-dienoyl-CoA reductase/sulfur reductase-like enzyme